MLTTAGITPSNNAGSDWAKTNSRLPGCKIVQLWSLWVRVVIGGGYLMAELSNPTSFSSSRGTIWRLHNTMSTQSGCVRKSWNRHNAICLVIYGQPRWGRRIDNCMNRHVFMQILWCVHLKKNDTSLLAGETFIAIFDLWSKSLVAMATTIGINQQTLHVNSKSLC